METAVTVLNAIGIVVATLGAVLGLSGFGVYQYGRRQRGQEREAAEFFVGFLWMAAIWFIIIGGALVFLAFLL